uniref:Trafficking protein particle complex subunit 2 n=1 Tax=Rhizophora mucronata TaxID=61149 RepID=A0A2P2K7G5_RHIMU
MNSISSMQKIITDIVPQMVICRFFSIPCTCPVLGLHLRILTQKSVPLLGNIYRGLLL